MILEPIFRFIESRAVVQQLGHPKVGGWMDAFSTSAGKSVDDNSSLTWSAIWAARNKLASALAQLPCKMKHRIEDGSSPDATENPLYWVLRHEPNPETNNFIFWEMMFDRWINFGNAYAEIVRAGNQIVELWPIHPTRCRPARNANGLYYEVTLNSGQIEPFDKSEILNIVGHLSTDGITGRGVIDFARECIGAALANQDYQSAYFSNGAVPRGVVTHPNKMPPEARNQFREEWNKIHRGGGNYGKLAILWEGMKYEAISDNAQESDAINKMRFSTEEVARWYDLPPHVIRDLTRSTNNNIESEQRSLLIDSYGPRITRVEASLHQQLLTKQQQRSNYYFKFNVDALLRGDPEKRVDVQNKRLLHGHITLNDIMRQEDMALLKPEIGDMRFFPLNHTTVDKAIEQPVPGAGDPIPGDPSGSDTPDDMQPGRPPERREQIKQIRLLEKIESSTANLLPVNDKQRDVVTACEQAVSAQLRRLVGVESNAVQRLAKKPNEFIAGIEEFYQGHSERMREALSPVVNARNVASGTTQSVSEICDKWCEESKRQLLDAADGPPDWFEKRVREVCEKWQTRIA